MDATTSNFLREVKALNVLPEDVEEFVDGWVKLWSPSAKDPLWRER